MINLNETRLGFVSVLISFVYMHFAVVVPWFVYVFKLLQIKQVDCKMSGSS